jgi:hypothetical protein
MKYTSFIIKGFITAVKNCFAHQRKLKRMKETVQDVQNNQILVAYVK